MTEEERAAEREKDRKEQNKDRLTGSDAMMSWSLFASAALAGGQDATKAAKTADAMIAEAVRRFT